MDNRAWDEETGPWTWVTRTDRNYRGVGKYGIKAHWRHQLSKGAFLELKCNAPEP